MREKIKYYILLLKISTCQSGRLQVIFTGPKPKSPAGGPVLISTHATLTYFCLNHGDQSVFQIKIIINVLVSSFHQNGCSGCTAIYYIILSTSILLVCKTSKKKMKMSIELISTTPIYIYIYNHKHDLDQ